MCMSDSAVIDLRSPSSRKPDWDGRVPASDDDAKERIVQAGMRCVERVGLTKTTIASVAKELRVTRQTVYRHFDSTNSLQLAITFRTGGDLVEKMLKAVERRESFPDRLAEAVAYLARHLPHDAYLGQYFALDKKTVKHAPQVFSDRTLQFCSQMLMTMYPDNQPQPSEKWFHDLALHAFRLLFTIVAIPEEPKRSPQALRAYLNQFLRPVAVYETRTGNHRPLQ